MQKKILLSLIAAAPTAIPALANINYGNGAGEWKSSSVGSLDTTTTPGTIAGNTLSGAANWMITLVPGSYQLTFETTKNVTVFVDGKAATADVADFNGTTSTKVTFTFEVSPEGVAIPSDWKDVNVDTVGKLVTISVQAAGGNGEYQFSGANLVMAFDAADEAGIYNALLQDKNGSDIEATKVIGEDVDADTKKELDAAADELNQQIADIKTLISENFKDLTATSTAAEIEAFKKFYLAQKLFYPASAPAPEEGEEADPISVLGQTIADLLAKIDAHNKSVADVDKDYKNTVDNTEYKNDLVDGKTHLLDPDDENSDVVIDVYGQVGLDKAIEALIKEIKAGTSYASGLNLKNAQDLQATITAYGAAIETAYDDMTVDPKDIKIKVTVKEEKDGVETDVEKELTYDEAVEYAFALNESIQAIRTKWTADNADGEAYAKIMNEFVVELQNATNDANSAIDDLDGLEAPVEGVTGFPATYTGVYNNSLKKVAKEQVAKLSNDAKAELELGTIAGAAQRLQDYTLTGYNNEDGDPLTGCADVIPAVAKAIAAVASELTTKIEGQNTAMTAAENAVKGYQAQLASLTLKTDESTWEDAYKEAIDAVKTALGKLGTPAEGETEAVPGTGLIGYDDEQYVAGNLNVTKLTDPEDDDSELTAYGEKVKAVEDALTQLQTVAGPIQGIIAVQNNFDDLKTKVDALGYTTEGEVSVTDFLPAYTEEGEGGKTHSGLYGLFDKPNGTFASIYDLIDDLTISKVEADENLLTDLNTAISNALASAQQLAVALINLGTYEKSYSDDVKGLKTWINSDELVALNDNGKPGNTVPKTAFLDKDPAKSFFDNYENFEGLVNGLKGDAEGKKADLTPNDIYTKATQIAEKIVKEEMVDKFDDEGNVVKDEEGNPVQVKKVTKLWVPQVATIKVAAAKAMAEANGIVLNGNGLTGDDEVKGLLAEALKNAGIGDDDVTYAGKEEVRISVESQGGISQGEGDTENTTTVIYVDWESVKGMSEDIPTEIQEIAADDTADVDDQVDAYAAVTGKIEAIIEYLDGLTEVANLYKGYQANYNALQDIIKTDVVADPDNDTPAVLSIDTLLKNLKEFNEKNNTPPAQAYFASYITGEEAIKKGFYADKKEGATLPMQLKAITDLMDEALEAYADPEKALNATRKAAFVSSLTDFKSAIADAEDYISKNKKANADQIAEGETVIGMISSALGDLETCRENAGLDKTDDVYVELKASLEDLLNDDCVNEAVKVSNYFGLGFSESKSGEIKADYQAIKDKLKKITDALSGDLNDAIKAVNEQNTEGWDALQVKVNGTYASATTEYNKYYYGLTNPGWTAYVLANTELKQTGDNIYQYAKQIDAKIAEVNALIKEHNGYTKEDGTVVAPTVLTKTAYEAATADLDDFVDALNEESGKLAGMMSRAAIDYYNGTPAVEADQSAGTQAVEAYVGLHERAETLVNSEETTLTAATLLTKKTSDDGEVTFEGVPDFTKAYNALKGAEKLYDLADKTIPEPAEPEELGEEPDDTEGTTTQADEPATGDDSTTPSVVTPINLSVGLAMNGIADLLDIANTALDMQTIAMDAWKAAYSEDKTKADGYVTALKADPQPETSVYKNATKEERDAAAAEISKYISNANPTEGETRGLVELNNAAKAIDEDFINDYANYKAELDALMAKIEAAQGAVKTISEGQTAIDDLVKDLNNDIKGYEKQYADLLEYAYTLAGGKNYVTTGQGATIREQIDNLNKFIKANRAELTSDENKAKLAEMQNSIEKLLADGFESIGYSEVQALEALLLQVKSEYNNVRSAYYGVDDKGNKFDGEIIDSLKGEAGQTKLAEWNKEINEFTDADPNNKDAFTIGDLEAMLTPAGDAEFDSGEFKNKAQGLEASLGNLYSTLTQSWKGKINDNGENPLPGVVESLNDQYNTVNTAIGAVNTLLDECDKIDTTLFDEDSKEAFDKAVEDAKTAIGEASESLEGMHTEWNTKDAEGNYSSRVLTMEGTYKAAMDQISATVKDINSTLTAAKEAADEEAAALQVNQDNYDRLNEILESLKTQLSDLEGEMTEEEKTASEATIANINVDITTAETALNAAFEAKELNGDSKLDKADEIQGAITGLALNIYQARKEAAKTAADSAIKAAQNLLKGNNIANATELSGQLQTIQEEFNAIGADAPTVPTVDYYKGLIEQYNNIVTLVNGLKTSIEDNTYQPGNVDGTEGVGATDIMQIATWALEGVSVDDIEADPEWGAKAAYAADLDHNGVINTTDVVMAINIMMGIDNPQVESVAERKLARFKAPAVQHNVGMGLMLVSEDNGVRRYAITLDNTMPIIGGQFDLKLPSGMRLVDVTAAERNSNHMVEYKENNEGARVILFSMENAEFNSTTGAILYIDVEGNGNLRVADGMVVDTYFNEHAMGAQGSSFVDSIIDGAKEVKSRIYNAAGMMFDKLQNGINIIRDSNGKVRKQMNRNK